jgi:hypothetical protein
VGLDEPAIAGLRAMILADGVQQLADGELRADEVAGLGVLRMYETTLTILRKRL